MSDQLTNQPAVQAPAGFVPAAAYDRLQALCDSQAARLLTTEGPGPVARDGWKLVPVEPTRAMLNAGSDDLRLGGVIGTLTRASECWRAMLASTPDREKPAEDARDAAFEAVRQRLCKLPRYSFQLDSRNNLRRCEEKTGLWVEFAMVHALLDPVAVDATIGARRQEGGAA